MRLSALLLAGALLAPRPARAALDCAHAPKKALPALLERFTKSGEKVVVHGVFARVLGGTAAPVLAASFREGESRHFFYISVAPGAADGEFQPDALLLATMTESDGRRERWIFKMSLAGELTSAAQVLDALDEKGDLVSGEEEFKPRSPHDPETARRLDRELKFFCRVSADGTKSQEEAADAIPHS